MSRRIERPIHEATADLGNESVFSMSQAKHYPWKLFWLLLGASLFGVAAVIPYVLALFEAVLEQHPLPFPLPIVLALQFAQSIVLFGLAVGIGLLVAPKIGLGAPVIEAWLYKQAIPAASKMFVTATIAGAAVGAVMVGLARFVFPSIVPRLPGGSEAAIEWWKRFLACFYGAFNEEILMRLFVLSLLLWLFARVWRNPEGQPSRGAFWATNFVVAILFGLGHMPAAIHFMPVNVMTVLYILSLNGTGSLLFGYLYWRRGLESAMVAHFSCDIVLHVIVPPLLLR